MIYEIFGFVRTLAIQPAVSFEQVRELRHGQAERIQTEDDYLCNENMAKGLLSRDEEEIPGNKQNI